jgi:hypothetical protein
MCISGFVCIGGSCVACKVNGENCGNDNMCCSNSCTSFKCD